MYRVAFLGLVMMRQVAMKVTVWPVTSGEPEKVTGSVNIPRHGLIDGCGDCDESYDSDGPRNGRPRLRSRY